MNTKPGLEEMREMAKRLSELLPPLTERIETLNAQLYRTPEEEDELKELEKYLKEILPGVEYILDFLGNKAFAQAVAIYYRAKELAANGNPEMQKIIDNLKPSFEEALRERTGEN